jgi:hypothetical protein
MKDVRIYDIIEKMDGTLLEIEIISSVIDGQPNRYIIGTTNISEKRSLLEVFKIIMKNGIGSKNFDHIKLSSSKHGEEDDEKEKLDYSKFNTDVGWEIKSQIDNLEERLAFSNSKIQDLRLENEAYREEINGKNYQVDQLEVRLETSIDELQAAENIGSMLKVMEVQLEISDAKANDYSNTIANLVEVIIEKDKTIAFNKYEMQGLKSKMEQMNLNHQVYLDIRQDDSNAIILDNGTNQVLESFNEKELRNIINELKENVDMITTQCNIKDGEKAAILLSQKEQEIKIFIMSNQIEAFKVEHTSQEIKICNMYDQIESLKAENSSIVREKDLERILKDKTDAENVQQCTEIENYKSLIVKASQDYSSRLAIQENRIKDDYVSLQESNIANYNLNERIEELSATKSANQSHINELKIALDSGKIQYESLKNNLTVLEEEITIKSKKLEEHDETLSLTQKGHTERESELNRIQSIIEIENNEKTASLEFILHKNIRLTNNIEQIKTDFKKVFDENILSRSLINELEMSLAFLREEFNENTGSENEQKQKLIELRRLNSDQQGQLSLQFSSLLECQNEIKKKDLDLDLFRKEQKEQENLIIDLKNERDFILVDIKELEIKLSRALQDIDEIDRSKNLLNLTITNLKENIEEIVEKNVILSMHESQIANETISKLKTEINGLNNSICQKTILSECLAKEKISLNILIEKQTEQISFKDSELITIRKLNEEETSKIFLAYTARESKLEEISQGLNQKNEHLEIEVEKLQKQISILTQKLCESEELNQIKSTANDTLNQLVITKGDAISDLIIVLGTKEAEIIKSISLNLIIDQQKEEILALYDMGQKHARLFKEQGDIMKCKDDEIDGLKLNVDTFMLENRSYSQKITMEVEKAIKAKEMEESNIQKFSSLNDTINTLNLMLENLTNEKMKIEKGLVSDILNKTKFFEVKLLSKDMYLAAAQNDLEDKRVIISDLAAKVEECLGVILEKNYSIDKLGIALNEKNDELITIKLMEKTQLEDNTMVKILLEQSKTNLDNLGIRKKQMEIEYLESSHEHKNAILNCDNELSKLKDIISKRDVSILEKDSSLLILKQSLRELESANIGLNESLKSIDENRTILLDKFSSSNTKISTLEFNLEKRAAEIMSATEEIEVLRADNRNELKLSQQENTMLISKLQLVREELDNLSKNYISVAAELKETQIKYNDYHTSISKLRVEDAVQLQRFHDNEVLYKSNVMNLQSDNAQLIKALTNNEKRKVQMNADELADIRSSTKDMEKTILSKETRIAELYQLIETKNNHNIIALNVLKDAITSLNMVIEKQLNQIKIAEDAIVMKSERYESYIKNLQIEISSNKQTIEKNAAVNSNLMDLLNDSENNVSSLKSKIARFDIETCHEEKQKIMNEQLLRKHHEMLLNEMTGLKESIEQKNVELKEYENRNKTTMVELDRKIIEINHYQTEEKNSKLKLANLMEDNNLLLGKNSQLTILEGHLLETIQQYCSIFSVSKCLLQDSELCLKNVIDGTNGNIETLRATILKQNYEIQCLKNDFNSQISPAYYETQLLDPEVFCHCPSLIDLYKQTVDNETQTVRQLNEIDFHEIQTKSSVINAHYQLKDGEMISIRSKVTELQKEYENMMNTWGKRCTKLTESLSKVKKELYTTTVLLAESQASTLLTEREHRISKSIISKINIKKAINLQLTINEIASIVQIERPCDDSAILNAQKDLRIGKISLDKAFNTYPIDSVYLIKIVKQVNDLAKIKVTASGSEILKSIALLEKQINHIAGNLTDTEQSKVLIEEQLFVTSQRLNQLEQTNLDLSVQNKQYKIDTEKSLVLKKYLREAHTEIKNSLGVVRLEGKQPHLTIYS